MLLVPLLALVLVPLLMLPLVLLLAPLVLLLAPLEQGAPLEQAPEVVPLEQAPEVVSLEGQRIDLAAAPSAAQLVEVEP